MSTSIVSPLIDALAAVALTLAAPVVAQAPSPIAPIAIATEDVPFVVELCDGGPGVMVTR